MKHIKTVWVSIYKCDRCGREFDGADRYNDYGKDQFPNVDAPPTMAHQCTPVCVGIARLVGLTERVDKANITIADTERLFGTSGPAERGPHGHQAQDH